jgi:hypothetical protein
MMVSKRQSAPQTEVMLHLTTDPVKYSNQPLLRPYCMRARLSALLLTAMVILTGPHREGPFVIRRSIAAEKLAPMTGKDITQLGADPTGAIDSTEAFQRCNGSRSLWRVPAGSYKIVGQLRLADCGLVGPGLYRRESQDRGEQGATLLISNSKGPAIIVGEHGGLLIKGLNFYWPEQDESLVITQRIKLDTGAGQRELSLSRTDGLEPGMSVADNSGQPPAQIVEVRGGTVVLSHPIVALLRSGAEISFYKPKKYPPLISSSTNGNLNDFTFSDNVVVNGYDFMHVNGRGGGDWRIMNNRIYAIHSDFDISASVAESTFAAHNLFSAGIMGGNGRAASWTALNGTWILLSGHADGLHMSESLVHGYRFGVHAIGQSTLNEQSFNSIDFVGVGTFFAIDDEAKGIVQFNGGTATNLLTNPISGQKAQEIVPQVLINTTGAVSLSFTGFGFNESSGSDIVVSHTGTRSEINIEGGRFAAWGMFASPKTYVPALVASAESLRLIVNGVSFINGYNQYADGIELNKFVAAAITSNIFSEVHTPLLVNGGGEISAVGNVSLGTLGSKSMVVRNKPTELSKAANLWDR